MLNQTRGLDKDGFIENLYSPKNIAPEFQGVVNAFIDSLLSELPEQIYGIYLYGSVPRGTAIVGRSDLDVSIVLTTPIGPKERRVFKHLSDTIPEAYPQVSKLDIDPGFLRDVLQPTEKYHWHFWLKHCCCCIWGKDLSTELPLYKPSIEIAQALNGDLPTFLEQMSLSFKTMADGDIAKVIGKKLVREAYYFVAEKDGSWYTDLSQCASVAKRYYPKQSDDIELAYQYALGNLISKTEAFELYERLSKKLVVN
ncbi:Nucleotidyltransferase domain-containing protein [Vibrio crassostreae]|uniref:nucleotidyltransferase domain-containing protein n=1 Tax=Vibrio crassostreae TaxID=246167 RepID=UPI001B30926D|nr:nucleotidyltransferase domain-containing protein [Vibrio crassostreae]CAK1870019.1 Nucleotidyltransferase domain-containing protein [Vibrio crassostreae]CAK1874194.1 Nucleotidyltransferase domain-containing protein [Vibrio crassostreae]CAK1883966.1 Nucleotidyltransferase domain-containing protein [Vibrio crassostreae]CAK1885888.1 Nucleotidyltransferase domain-containing protein [Vibrio crassostreae]CAK1938182.1 Nucleotidyltransferase domain-containing protein [Vibrio crassostreae]